MEVCNTRVHYIVGRSEGTRLDEGEGKNVERRFGRTACQLEERCGDETERGFIQDPVHAIADY